MRQLNICIFLSFIHLTLFSQISFTDLDRLTRITKDVKALSHDTMMGRKSATKYEWKAGNYIISELNKISVQKLPGYESFRLAFTINNDKIKRDTTADIIAYIDNGAPYTIILGAHYDHIRYEVYDITKNQYLIYNGADDNASGVACLLELARHLSTGFLPQHNYIIAFWGSEEIGLYGSTYFCQKILINLKVPPIILYINYDMVGSLGYKKNELILYGSATGKNIKKYIPRKYDTVKIIKLPVSFSFSDHTCFYKNKIPYLYFTTGLPKVYHTIKDEFRLINFNGILFTLKLTEYILETIEIESIRYNKACSLNYIITGVKLLMSK